MARRSTPSSLAATRLRRLRRRIEAAEARLEGLYAQRVEAFRAGRCTGDNGRPLLTFPEMADAAGVSEEAIHKALKKAQRRADANASAGS